MVTHVTFNMYSDQDKTQNTVNSGIWSSPEHDQYGGHLFVMADGYGPAKRAEFASRFAVEQTGILFYEQVAARPTILSSLALEHVLQQVNIQLYREAYTLYTDGMMGTSIIAGVLRNRQLTLAWLGNCRAYLVSEKTSQAEQLTRDFFLQRDSDDTLDNEPPGILGMMPYISLRTKVFSLDPGDTVLLTSSHFYDYVPPEHYKAAITSHDKLNKSSHELLKWANRRQRWKAIGVLMLQVPKRYASSDISYSPAKSDQTLSNNLRNQQSGRTRSKRRQSAPQKSNDMTRPLESETAFQSAPDSPDAAVPRSANDIQTDQLNPNIEDLFEQQWLISGSVKKPAANRFITSETDERVTDEEVNQVSDMPAYRGDNENVTRPLSSPDADVTETDWLNHDDEVAPDDLIDIFGTTNFDDDFTSATDFNFDDSPVSQSAGDEVIDEVFSMLENPDKPTEELHIEAEEPLLDDIEAEKAYHDRQLYLKQLDDIEQRLAQEFANVIANDDAYETSEPAPIDAMPDDADDVQVVSDEADWLAPITFAQDSVLDDVSDSSDVVIPIIAMSVFDEEFKEYSDDEPEAEADEAPADAVVDEVEVEADETLADAVVDEVEVEADEVLADAEADEVEVEADEAPEDAVADKVEVEASDVFEDIMADEAKYIPNFVRHGRLRLYDGLSHGGVDAVVRHIKKHLVLYASVVGGAIFIAIMSALILMDQGNDVEGIVVNPTHTPTITMTESNTIGSAVVTLPPPTATIVPTMTLTYTPAPTATPYDVPNDWRAGTVLYITEETGLHPNAFSPPTDPEQYQVGDTVIVSLAPQRIGYREWYDGADERWWFLADKGWLPESVLSDNRPRSR